MPPEVCIWIPLTSEQWSEIVAALELSIEGDCGNEMGSHLNVKSALAKIERTMTLKKPEAWIVRKPRSHEHVGPFASSEEAEAWASAHVPGYTVIRLEAPTE